MNYNLVKSYSAAMDFFSFTKAEATMYFEWFLKIKPERLGVLAGHVTSDFPDWRLDYSVESLEILYKWFKSKVEYRPVNKNEIDAFQKQIEETPIFVGLIPLPKRTFTDQTVSICFDIGLYLGDLLIYNIPGMKWSQSLRNKNFIYYAQPLVAKQGRVEINPRAAVEGMAMRILDRDVEEVTFVEQYLIWKGMQE